MTHGTRRDGLLSSLNIALLAIAVLFILWGLGFIYRSSTAAIDGRRYFSLVDDAMISMRYAWNLTHGLGLVWNAGERVEGYSNLLMVLWMAIPTAILDKSTAVLLVQLSGIAMMLGTAWMTMQIARLTTAIPAAGYASLVHLNVAAFALGMAYLMRNDSAAINAATRAGASVGVIRAGTIPYYTGRIAVDYLGKNDPHIANLPPDLSGQISWNGMYSVSGHNKYDLEYSIKGRLPTYSEGFEWGSQNLNEWAREHYAEVKYHEIRLDLLRDSPLVNWDEVQLMTRDKKSTNPPGN